MRYRAILPLAAISLALGVAGCGGGGNIGDVIDTVTGWIPDTKKPLPGERRPVFPEGVPGVPQGVPPEMVKGYQAAPETAMTPEPAPANEPKQAKRASREKPKAGAPQAITPADPSEEATASSEKPKPKKKTAAKPPAQPAQPNQPTQPPQNQANQAAWPGVPPARSAPAPWPATQSQPGTAWPDPRQPAQ